MKNALDDGKIKDTTIDNVEVVIDTFAEHFLTGDVQKIVVDLPVIKNVTAVVALVHNVRNYAIANKISAFVKAVREGSADKPKYRQLSDKYGKERILEEILMQIDRFGKQEQAEIYGRLFSALLDGEFDWKEYCTLAFFIEQTNPIWLAKPFDSLRGVEDISATTNSLELTRLSIALGPFGFEGDDHSHALAWKFWRFGLRPFQESHKDK